MRRIHAVLAGVDRYARTDVPQLRGCVNDVLLVRRVLKVCFGVPNRDIRVVTNDRATKAAILGRLRAALRRAEPGDVIVFYFSGHGSQIRDRDGDELRDALDELICPFDMDWDRGTYILDDDLDEVFGALPPGVLIEALLDCCFWGAGPQDLRPGERTQALQRDVRWLQPPVDIVARYDGDEDVVERHALAGCHCLAQGGVYWSASQEGQPAGEDVFDGRAHGVFTYWGCRAIEEYVRAVGPNGYTRQELFEHLLVAVREYGYAQEPALAATAELRAGPPFEPSPQARAWTAAARAGWLREPPVRGPGW